MEYADKITEIVLGILKEKNLQTEDTSIPVGISNRHIHLSAETLAQCFGEGYELTPIKELSQPGQFACKETMTIAGPKGAIEKVRILGPVRKQSQVELLAADNFKLGIKAPLRMSGDLKDSASVTLIGPKGSAFLQEGAIVAQRHIHMNLQEAEKLGVHDGEIVKVEVEGPRGGIFGNMVIRANDASALDCHVDMEEANAMGLTGKSRIRIVK